MNTEFAVFAPIAALAAGGIIMWMNARMNRLERRLEMLADHFGASKPQKKMPLRNIWQQLLALACAGVWIALTGCAMTHQVVTGIEGQTTESHVWAVWPATSVIDSAAVKQEGPTQSIGLSGIAMETAGTNTVEALKEARQIIQAVVGAAK